MDAGDPRPAGRPVKVVSSARQLRPREVPPPPPSRGRAGPAGPQGLKAAARRARSSASARRTWRSAARRPGAGFRRGLAESGRGENVTSAGSGGRRSEAARTCPCPSAPPAAARTRAPPPPAARAQSARREHDFCLQAGFPPGHDGRGPPASSRQN